MDAGSVAGPFFLTKSYRYTALKEKAGSYARCAIFGVNYLTASLSALAARNFGTRIAGT